MRPEKFFTTNDVDARLGVHVTSIDRAARTVALDDGTTLAYSKLVLATGAANRELAVPGADLAGIHGLRTLTDAQALHARLDAVRSVVVIGAGFIGLEFAAAARARGLDVTVLEYADRPMGRALTPVMSGFFADAHQRLGVTLRLGEGIASFDGDDGHVTAAVSTTGQRYPADLVLVGVGVTPRTELAAAAGLEVENGIVVDGSLRTSDPDIYALGDCASFPNAHAGTRTRLESVQNATDQARHAARAIVGTSAQLAAEPGSRSGGESNGYSDLPWFWSNQGPLRLQIAGLVSPRRPDRAPRKPGRREVLRVLLPRRHPGRGRVRQPARRPHGRPPPARRRPQPHPRTSRRPRIRPQDLLQTTTRHRLTRPRQHRPAWPLGRHGPMPPRLRHRPAWPRERATA